VSLTHAPSETKVPDVTVVLPCYNERDHVELEIKRIKAALEEAGMTYELICVDDGSTDGTRDILQATPGGPHHLAAPQPGRRHRQADWHPGRLGAVVVWTDADMTYPNDRIPSSPPSWTTPGTRWWGPARPRPAPTGWPGCRPSARSASWPPTDRHRDPRPELGAAGLQAQCGRAVPAATRRATPWSTCPRGVYCTRTPGAFPNCWSPIEYSGLRRC
jgi:Glycosyl transferase family 2